MFNAIIVNIMYAWKVFFGIIEIKLISGFVLIELLLGGFMDL